MVDPSKVHSSAFILLSCSLSLSLSLSLYHIRSLPDLHLEWLQHEEADG